MSQRIYFSKRLRDFGNSVNYIPTWAYYRYVDVKNLANRVTLAQDKAKYIQYRKEVTVMYGQYNEYKG